MATKTTTVTKNAYDALKSMKAPNESFSETILRFAKRKPLTSFFGVLSRETGERMEKTIGEMRKKNNKAHHARIKAILEGMNT